ncbi:HigA family addiction module antitoxin [Caulobacter sp. 17J65-9]|uniref:HigA family addiction module antitoxin n=1 Tax=Caulobacter sp. 17J65-9 TaxID=2709382 RepID=UPI0013CC9625|nr:HigA family addiction module antitoxin [Caulobacter sp. 17J65-9]NEX93208.1 HigA family addiction module antidote protein [Caulobacter sp. 17J65-9]
MAANIAATAESPLSPVHPGEILSEEFLKPLELAPYTAAKLMKVPRTRIERLARCEGPVTPDTALRLERLFGASAQFWMNLQTRYDLLTTAAAERAELDAIKPLDTAA